MFLSCKSNSGKAKSVMPNCISAKVSKRSHVWRIFLVLVLELHALEHSVFDGFDRDEGEEEREVLFGGVYNTKEPAAQSWRTG